MRRNASKQKPLAVTAVYRPVVWLIFLLWLNNNAQENNEDWLCQNEDIFPEDVKTSFGDLTLISRVRSVSPLDEKLIELSCGYEFW